MYEFEYEKADSLEAAADALSADEEAMVLAGGMTLIPTLKQRLAMPTKLVDLAKIEGLNGIEREGENVLVGAMTPHAAVHTADTVTDSIPALAYLAGLIGDPQVRNRGTLGGSLANSDPAADYPAAVLGLGATVVTNKREIAADDFFIDMFETALEPGEIIKAVRFPIPKRAAYRKFPNPASRYAVVGVFVAETNDGIRVAVTGAGPNAFRVTDMEQALADDFSAKAIANIQVDSARLNSDMHASADYRAHLVTVMAKRAVADLTES